MSSTFISLLSHEYVDVAFDVLVQLRKVLIRAPSRRYDSVETYRIGIICEIMVHLLVIVQNNKRCTVHVLK